MNDLTALVVPASQVTIVGHSSSMTRFDDILRRTSGKLFSKADSPITRTVQVLSVDCVKTRDNDTFWAYTAITDDDYFVKFNQSTQICNPMDVITIKGSFRETDIEYRTKLPVTKLFRVKQL